MWSSEMMVASQVGIVCTTCYCCLAMAMLAAGGSHQSVDHIVQWVLSEGTPAAFPQHVQYLMF